MLAQCTLLTRAGKPILKRKFPVIPFGTPDAQQEDEHEEMLILFRVDDPSEAGASKIVKEGGEVSVWKPWMKMALPEDGSAGPGMSEVLENLGVKTSGLGKEVTFCSRYLVKVQK